VLRILQSALQKTGIGSLHGGRLGRFGRFVVSCAPRSGARLRSPQGNLEWQSSDPSTLHDPNGVTFYFILHQWVKCVPRGNGDRNAKSLRELVFDLHQAEHVRNLRFRVIVNKRSRSLSDRCVPRAREPNMNRPVAPFARNAAPYFLSRSIKAARFIGLDIATIGTPRRDRWSIRHSGPSARDAYDGDYLRALRTAFGQSVMLQRFLPAGGRRGGGDVTDPK
jgi:hypothetical protein